MTRGLTLSRSTVQWTGLVAGPVLAILTYGLLPDAYRSGEGQTIAFSHAGRCTAAVGVWMALWWMTEAIPVYATALLPLTVLPAIGAVSMTAAAAPYGHELIFLFMGGFIIALAMQRWGLPERFALTVIQWVGTRPRRLVGGFMGVTAALSMWVSNTATVIMMLPIALSAIRLVLRQEPSQALGGVRSLPEGEGRDFATCLLLAIAYGASIGGIGTLIGTPPNLFLASYMKSHLGLEISFVRWMGIGLPLVIVFLPLVWLLLTLVLFPIRRTSIEGGAMLIREAAAQLEPMKPGGWVTLGVFVLAAVAWIARPLLVGFECGGLRPLAGLSDTGVAMIAALALFAIPVDIKRRIFVIDWETAVKLPWGVLLLFGGGLSLAAAIRANGVDALLGNQVVGLAGLPPILVVLSVTALVIFLTELTSNTATTAALVPILSSLAPGLGLHPYLLIVPATIAASCAFMLPVATPPNAIVFGSGHLTIPQMCRAGLWLNLLGVILITALTYAIAMPLLGVDPG